MFRQNAVCSKETEIEFWIRIAYKIEHRIDSRESWGIAEAGAKPKIAITRAW